MPADSTAQQLVSTEIRPWSTKIPRLARRTPLLSAVHAQWLPLAFLLAAPAVMTLDRSVAQWCSTHALPSELRKLPQIGELYSNGLVVPILALIIDRLDVAKRRFLPHLLTAAWGAGITADLIKLVVGRIRPHHFNFHGNVWSTFTGLFPILSGGSTQQSFPSAHVAVAAGLTTVLVRLYPRAAWLFVVLAALAGCQRILCGAHYVSDVFVGAAVGLIFARMVLSTRWFALPAGQVRI